MELREWSWWNLYCKVGGRRELWREEEGMWREEKEMWGRRGEEGGVEGEGGGRGEEGGKMRKVGSVEGRGGMELCVWLLHVSSLKHLFSR